uniref:ISXO2-like transposase domain-containing protein n=1 Tax=Octopus bimaculoides TaxID=37653 RepID=A0A0L8GK31_OCTBM
MCTPLEEVLNQLAPQRIMDFLKTNGIVANSKTCVCTHEMCLKKSARSIDGFTWRCSNCKKAISLRKNTFMENSKLPLCKMFNTVFHFVFEVPVSTAAFFTGLDNKTAIQWYEFCREVCSAKILQDKAPLGGPGHEVEVDESLFFKRKNVDRIGHQTLVVVCYDNTTERSTATLESVIRENVLPGSVIYTDLWASYENLHQLGYIHRTMTHSNNHIKAYWSRIKRRVRFISESSARNKFQNFHTFLKHIAEVYPQ